MIRNGGPQQIVRVARRRNEVFLNDRHNGRVEPIVYSTNQEGTLVKEQIQIKHGKEN